MVRIINRGASDLYLQLEGNEYRATTVEVPDTRNRLLRWAQGRIEAWRE